MADAKYIDLDLDFTANPTTKDVQTKTNQEAIKRSVRNLILLNTYEKPFHPEIGSDVRNLLFEPAIPLTAIRLKDAIKEVITNFEPRVLLRDVLVSANLDSNEFNVSIIFSILNSDELHSMKLSLERLR